MSPLITDHCADCGRELQLFAERVACALCFEYKAASNPTRCRVCLEWHKVDAHGADPHPSIQGKPRPTRPA